jgi:hypothetical protein
MPPGRAHAALRQFSWCRTAVPCPRTSAFAGGIENNNMNNSQGGAPLTRKPRTEDYQPSIGAAAYNALPDAAYNGPPDAAYNGPPDAAYNGPPNAAGRGAGDGYQPGFSIGVPVPSPNAGGAAPRDRSGDICFK